MAITFPATTLADGALISKTFIDMIVDDINHLVDRPDAYHASTTTGQTATTASYTQLANPTITVTPKRTGNLLILGSLTLQGTATQTCIVRFDINGSKIGNTAMQFVANAGYLITFFGVAAVTADVAYTIKIEFNNNAASGTITALNTFPANLYAIEVGA